MARLAHPNIVRVLGGCLRSPNLFVVMELMSKDLASYIHRRGEGAAPLHLFEAITIALDITKGLVRIQIIDPDLYMKLGFVLHT